MSLRPIGGIFARLDSSGNLTFYDSSGNVVGKFIGGVFSTHINFNNQISPSLSDITTISTTPVSTGFGASLTPQVSGTVHIDVQGTFLNTTASDGIAVIGYYTTGAIPAAGAAVTGTQMTNTTIFIFNTSPTYGRFQNVVTGLTVGTAYNFYVAFEAITGGTATIKGLSAVALVGVSFFGMIVRES